MHEGSGGPVNVPATLQTPSGYPRSGFKSSEPSSERKNSFSPKKSFKTQGCGSKNRKKLIFDLKCYRTNQGGGRRKRENHDFLAKKCFLHSEEGSDDLKPLLGCTDGGWSVGRTCTEPPDPSCTFLRSERTKIKQIWASELLRGWILRRFFEEMMVLGA